MATSPGYPASLSINNKTKGKEEFTMKRLRINKGLERFNINILYVMIVFILSAYMLSGCMVTKEAKQSSDVREEKQIAGTPESRNLSYGMVTSKVKKGITTQQEILDFFGGPNITTINSNDEETWVYEITSSHSQSEIKETGISSAKRFDLFFGLGLYGTRSGEAEKRTIATVERSIKTLTVIIKFNPDKSVSDYSARASYF